MTSQNVNDHKRRVLYVVNEDWAFYSHFLERAIAAKVSGYVVGVATHCSTHKVMIESHGIEVFPTNMTRRGLNPIRELATILTLAKIYRKFRPHLIHHVALKSIVLGSIATLSIRDVKIINAPIGMGYIFSSDDSRAHFLRPFLKFALQHLLDFRDSQVIIENQDDYDNLIQENYIDSDKISLIRGAGVNLNIYKEEPEPPIGMTVTLIARMLRDKGIQEFVGAATILKDRHPAAEFLLVGDVDKGNPASLSVDQLEKWTQSGIVNWVGHQTNIPSILANSNIVCLPSYREGLPKTLIEAAAVGRAIVTTDVPGCREVVEHGVNGLLIPPREIAALGVALEMLINDAHLRKHMGQEGHKRAVTQFSSDIIIRETLNTYRSLLTR
jgi:glycosyltransferase involved in cell wall biosynthesis